MKYIRFQMGALAGFIVTFLGASILNIVAGVPFLPLQTLWINFTTQVFQAIGLGYGEPRGPDGARARASPRSRSSRGRRAGSSSPACVMAIATLAVPPGPRTRTARRSPPRWR